MLCWPVKDKEAHLSLDEGFDGVVVVEVRMEEERREDDGGAGE